MRVSRTLGGVGDFMTETIMMNSDHMRSAISEIFAIVSRREAEPLRDWLAESVVMEYPYAYGGLAERYHGREAVVEAMRATREMFSDFRLTPTAFFASPINSTMIVEAHSEGLWRDGRSYANRYVMVFKFGHGKVTLWREYFDPLKLGSGARAPEVRAVQ